MPQNNSSKNTGRKVFELPQKISNAKGKTPKKISNGMLIALSVLIPCTILFVPAYIGSIEEKRYAERKLENERQVCEDKQGYQWDGSKCVEKKSDDISPDSYRKDTSSNSNPSSPSSSSSSTTKKAYGSDPNDPDTYTGAGESIKEKQLRAHILCKNYAEDYFYPDKVSFSSVTGVVTDEEQYNGWRYDVMMDVKSAAGGKRSYIMHCIAGGFNTKDYSDGKVTMFEALPR